MLFILIIIVFSFISIMALFGNVEDKELKKDNKKYKEIVGRKYEWMNH